MAKKKGSKLKYLVLAVILIAIVAFLILPEHCLQTSTGGNPCITQSGFLCQNPTFNPNTGNISVVMGQNIGTNWTNVYMVFVPVNFTNTTNGVPNVSFTPPNAVYLPRLNSGTVTPNLTFHITAPNTCSYEAGTIWASYTVDGVNQYYQMASMGFHFAKYSYLTYWLLPPSI
ncbi:MAG: hypothetical protein ABR981_00805 [Candidatus Micrarchaeaceae archaeon]|jgi:hypothetical protein